MLFKEQRTAIENYEVTVSLYFAGFRSKSFIFGPHVLADNCEGSCTSITYINQTFGTRAALLMNLLEM